MGCCCRRSRELQELDAERETLMNKNKLLESKILTLGNQETESNASSMRPDYLKFIDHDQYSSSKIIEILLSLASGDQNVYQALSQTSQSLNSSKDDEKLLKYAELRVKQTDLQKKLVQTCQDSFKDLVEITNSKISNIESRFEKVENLLNSSFFLSEERHSIKKKLETIPKNPKQDFPSTILTLKTLETLEKELFLIESRLPKLVKDNFFLLKLNQVERTISALVKASLVSTTSLDSVFGNLEVPNTIDVQALKSFELETVTFDGLFESLVKTISSLTELETSKTKSIETHDVQAKLKEIENLLTKHFVASEKNKDDACSKLNRVSRGFSGVNFLTASSLFKIEENKRTIPDSVMVLKSKAEKYLKSLESQDKLLLEMIEKFGKVDFVIDEIELKFHEFFSFEVKELHKSVNVLEDSMKTILNETNEKIISYQKEAQKDVLERLQFLLEKLSVTENLLKVKNAVKEANNKEISRIKTEMLEKIYELQTQTSSLEHEKELMINSLQTTKSQLTIASEMADSQLKASSEKDLQSTELKNIIASLQKELETTSDEKSKLEAEVDDLQKKLKKCKKAQRAQKKEIEELQQSLSKDD